MEKFAGFLKKILTLEDLLFWLGEIRIAENLIFLRPEIPLFEKLKGSVSQEFLEELKRLESAGIFPKNPPEMEDFFRNLKDYLQKLPILKIELAFSPSREFLEKLASLFQNWLQKKVILDIKYRPEIIGGVILEFEGKYLNLSLSKEVEKKINEILKK